MKYLPVILGLLLLVSSAGAADDADDVRSVPGAELDEAIDHVISQPEYAWRLARRKDEAATGFWTAFWDNIWKQVLGPLVRPAKALFKRVRKMLKRIGRWVKDMFTWKPSPTGGGTANWQDAVRALLFLVLAITLSLLVILALRIWRTRIRRGKEPAVAARPTVSDILEERVTADDLPMDEWMTMAREFLDKGELRLAVRAMFLGCLVCLANRDKLTIARHKSNREYIRELNRRAHDAPDVLAAFSENVGIVERLWYGMHKATEEMVAAFSDNQERIVGPRPRTAGPPATPQAEHAV